MSELRKRKLLPPFPSKCDLEQFGWPLEARAYSVLWLLLPFCPFWWVIDRHEPECTDDLQEREWNRRRANWVIGWLALLFVLWIVNPGPAPLKLIFGVIAAWRLLEIFVTGLGTILDQRQQIRARNVITILIYVVQVVFIFAILFHSFAATEFATSAKTNPSSPPDFIYISWAAVVSLGQNEFSAEKPAAQLLEVGATTASLFLLGVLLSYAIDELKKHGKGDAGKGLPKSPCLPRRPETTPSEPPTAHPPCDKDAPYPRLSFLVDALGGWKRLREKRMRQRLG